uniref:Ig-like domain-containing protein n=1 Tax=Mariniflexile sp. TaxID=1979402 RepID=UPI0040484A18
MKTFTQFKKALAILFFMASPIWVIAQAPTTPSTNFSTSSINGNSLAINFTKGDGAKRIVIAKQGSAVTAVPSNGADYTPGAFGVGNQILPGEYVVYEGTAQSNILISGLQHSTTYYFRIYEFNGSDSTTQYLTSLYLDGSGSTLTYPTGQASFAATPFTNVLGSSMTVNFTAGTGGSGRILIARANSPVDVEPQDLVSYNASPGAFGNAAYQIGTGNYGLFQGNGTSATITGLEPNTTYHFALFEFNGSGTGKVYLTTNSTISTPGATASQLTNAYPTDNAKGMAFSNIDGDRFYRFLTGGNLGNGQKRIVVAKQGSAVTQLPVDGQDYTASNVFGNGDELGFVGSGEYVMYDGTNGTDWNYGLQPNTTYYFKVFEYNGSSTETFYLVGNDADGDPVFETSQATIDYPTGQAGFAATPFTNVLGSSMTVNFTAGTGGSGRILIAKANSPVDVEPQDLVNYNASPAAFGNASYQIGTGNYGLYQGAGTSTTITGLEPNTTYHFALFEYNGSNGKLYLTTNSTISTPGATASQLTNAYPTDNAKGMTFSNIDGDRFYRFLTGGNLGNGQKRIVVAKQGSAVTQLPVDGVDYTASSTFGNGDELGFVGSGEYVMYDGTNGTDWNLGLQPNTTYYFKVFEYNGSSTETFYLVGNDADGDPVFETSQATIDYPTGQAGFAATPFTNVLGSSMTVNFTAGTGGSGRILIARANSPVDVEPQDLVNYTASTNAFGNAYYQIGTGNYGLYQGAGTSTTITGLEPNTIYYFALFEYNGTNGKLYLTTSSTISTPGATASQLTNAYPTDNAKGMAFSNIDGDRFFRRLEGGNLGNGEKRIVVCKQGSPVTQFPVDGVDYNTSDTFGSGDELGFVGSGEFVMYDGTNGNAWTYGLQPNTTYYFKVFEYNGSGTETFYLVGNDADGDPVFETSQATISYPTVNSSNAFFDSKTTTSFNLNWTKGDGTNRILIARANAPVDVEPQDLLNYSAYSGGFGNPNYEFKIDGVGTGNYVLYAGTGTSVNITNLLAGQNYHFALFEFNGSSGKLYLRPGYDFALETFGERPTLQVSNAQFTNIDFNSFDVSFTPGNGTRRLVIAREGSPVNAAPSDFATYTANSIFGNGDELGSGNFVVFNDFGENFSLSGLNPSTAYYFAFYEYAINENGELYMGPAYTSSKSTKQNHDIGVSQILSPESGCNLTSNEQITVEVTNYSDAIINAFQVAYSLNDNPPVIETISGENNISPQGKFVFSFQSNLDLSAVNTYSLNVYTILNGDIDDTNNGITAQIIHFPNPIISISDNATICNGEQIILTASGGTSYLWSTGETTGSITATPSSTTQYSVEVTNDNGCSSNETVTVTVTPLPIVNLELGFETLNNTDSIINLNMGTPSGGTYYFSYDPVNPITNITPSNLNLGSYTIVYTYVENNCTNSVSDTFEFIESNIQVTAPDLDSICENQSDYNLPEGTPIGGTWSGLYVENNVFKTSEATPGIYNLTYSTVQASDETTIEVLAVQSSFKQITICKGEIYKFGNQNYSETGVYTIIDGTQANGCEIERTLELTVSNPGEAPIIQSSAGTAICEGSSTLLSTQYGGAIKWRRFFEGEFYNLGDTPEITISEPGEYTAILSNDIGCEINSQPFVLQVLEQPNIISLIAPTICLGETIVLSVENSENQLWSTGLTSNSITVAPSVDTEYTVEGTFNNGCEFSDSIVVKVIPASAPISVSNILPANQSVNINQPIRLSWSPGNFTVLYDLFLWPANESKPSEPLIYGLDKLEYNVRNLNINTEYSWQIISRNSCFSTEGPIQNFTAAGIPDITINNPTYPLEAISGNTITVSWEVNNIGTGNTNNATWKDRIWLSPDLDLRAGDDIMLGEFDNISALIPGESYTNSQQVSIPLGITGNYYLFIITDNKDAYCRLENGVCISERGDHGNWLSEFDESNNFVYQQLFIDFPPTPDLNLL